MKYSKHIFITFFATLLLGSALVLETQAQSRRTVVVQRPVVVNRVITRRPFWRYRSYRPYWGYSGFYDPYHYSPYLRYAEQKYYLERELRGNQRELAEHQEKYRADGVISAKEQRELEDDIRDVQRAKANLSRFLRNN